MTQSCKRSGAGRLAGLLDPRLFRALCDPRRTTLLADLAQRGGSAKVGEVAACCGVDLSVVSRHLATLRTAGVLEAERRGKEVHYRIRCGALAAAFRALAEAIETCCPEAPERAGGRGRRKS